MYHLTFSTQLSNRNIDSSSYLDADCNELLFLTRKNTELLTIFCPFDQQSLFPPHERGRWNPSSGRSERSKIANRKKSCTTEEGAPLHHLTPWSHISLCWIGVLYSIKIDFLPFFIAIFHRLWSLPYHGGVRWRRTWIHFQRWIPLFFRHFDWKLGKEIGRQLQPATVELISSWTTHR